MNIITTFTITIQNQQSKSWTFKKAIIHMFFGICVSVIQIEILLFDFKPEKQFALYNLVIFRSLLLYKRRILKAPPANPRTYIYR